MIKRLLMAGDADLFTGDVFGVGRHRILRISLSIPASQLLFSFLSLLEVR